MVKYKNQIKFPYLLKSNDFDRKTAFQLHSILCISYLHGTKAKYFCYCFHATFPCIIIIQMKQCISISVSYILLQCLAFLVHCMLRLEIFFIYQQLIFSLTRVSLTHSFPHGQCNRQLFRQYFCCSWINLGVLYGYATQNLIRKPFIMVRGVKKLSLCGPFDLLLRINI